MRIRTQLLLATASGAVVSLIVLASLWYVTERNAANLLSQTDSQEIARDVANLLTLTQEYTVYGGDRTASQWHAWHSQLLQTIERAVARESRPDPALTEMRQRVLDLLPLYQGLEDAYRDRGFDLAQRRRELMIERLVSETQELVDARHRWATAINERQAFEQRVAYAIVLSASAVLLVLIVGLGFLVARRGLMPLARLQAATAAIQRGDLSVRCDSSAQDELGETGRAVNAMAESLLAANAALRESQERYRLAVAGSDDGVFDWDYRSGRAFGSARARGLLGLPPGPEMQSTAEWFAAVEAHLHPDDVPRRAAAIEAHMAGRAPTYEGEFRVRNEDGSDRWVRIRGLCIRDAAGTPYRMAGSVSDIDARKRAEESLRQSEKRFALAVMASNEGILDWDIVNDRLYSSERAMHIVGIDSEVTTRSRHEWRALVQIHPDDVQRVDDDFQRLLDGRSEARDCEYRVLLPDGQYRWIHHRSICIRDANGRPIRTAGSLSDIDARKRAEEALSQSEERFALAVAGSNDGILDWDIVNDRMFTSERALQIVGVAPGPTIRSRGEWIALLKVHPDDRAAHDEAIRKNLAGETEVRDQEHRILHPDGNYRWVRVRGTCVRDASGRAIRWAGSVSDIDARKRAEESLRLSEERYAIAMTGSEEAHWVWNVKTDELFASPQLHRLLGNPESANLVTRAEWMAKLPMHPDDRSVVEKAVRDHLAGMTPRLDVEYRVVDASGRTTRWVHTRGQCFRDAEGKPDRVAGATVEITQRKRAEQSLRQSEERFALAVAGSNDGILDWDIVDDRMYVSERALNIVGLAPGTVVHTQGEWAGLVMPRFHPEDAARLNDELDRASIRDSHDGEYRVRDATGEYRWIRFRGRSVRDSSGRPIRWSGSLSDIDAKKRTEQALRQSEARYQLAVDGANQGLWDWDLESNMQFVSPRAQELLGLPPGEPLRHRREWVALAIFHPDDIATARAATSAHLRGHNKYFEVECRMRHQSGAWHWYRQRGVALRDETGRPYRMAGSMEDITAQKNAEVEQARLERQLLQAKKLESIGTLAGGIAHDFNNILAAILGNGEMAQSESQPGTSLRRHVDAVVSAGTRAKSLVERILAFSRSGMGDRVSVHVQSVVDEALHLVATSLPPHVRLERHLAAGDARVLADPTQIHQVVMNLCTNAVQAMKSKGTLSVALEIVEGAETITPTSAPPSGRYVRLRVRDTGVGIPENALDRIFDPFFTTKDVGVGTGLGLSLVHGIVTDVGGRIDVDSKVGEGTTFTVYLPWNTSLAAPVSVEEEVPSGAGETILLIDDEEPLVRLGEEMLARLGYEPVGFTSSIAALEDFRASPERFRAVLSDQAMPDMTGVELAKEIRTIRPDLPIVLMSGFVSSALLARAQGVGITEILVKPLVARDIARSLAGALARAAVSHQRVS